MEATNDRNLWLLLLLLLLLLLCLLLLLIWSTWLLSLLSVLILSLGAGLGGCGTGLLALGSAWCCLGAR